MRDLCFFCRRSAMCSMLILALAITTLSYITPCSNDIIVNVGEQVTVFHNELSNKAIMNVELTPAILHVVYILRAACMAINCPTQQRINVDFGEMSRTDFLLGTLP